MVGVEARPAQLGRVLRERHGVAPLGRHAPHLGRHELGVPDGRDAQRDEAARVGAAPVLDVPVVVGPQHVDGELLVLGAGEELAAELDEGGEAHRPEHAVGVHVPDPLVDVVATLAHLLERGRLDAVLLGGTAHHGVEAHVGDEVALEGPHVGAVVVVDDARGAVLPLGRDAALEHVGGLDDVVVDAHEDEIFGLHRAPPPLLGDGAIIYLTSVSGTRRPAVLHCAPMHADAPRGLAGIARADPDRVALVFGDRRMTFGELDARRQRHGPRLRPPRPPSRRPGGGDAGQLDRRLRGVARRHPPRGAGRARSRPGSPTARWPTSSRTPARRCSCTTGRRWPSAPPPQAGVPASTSTSPERGQSSSAQAGPSRPPGTSSAPRWWP